MDLKALFHKYKHILLLLYVPIYLVTFNFIENELVSWNDFYWVSYMPIDDVIPFCEWFVIPYVLWYPFMLFTGVYLFFADANAFRRYMWFIIIGFSTSLIFYVIFPNGQNLRPATFDEQNILTEIMAHIYKTDTNTNVCPSMHCIGAIAVFLAFSDCEKLKKHKFAVASAGVMTILICLSTCFCKQHSFADVIMAIIWCAALYVLVYVFMKNHMNNVIASERQQKTLSLK